LTRVKKHQVKGRIQEIGIFYSKEQFIITKNIWRRIIRGKKKVTGEKK